MSGHAPPSRFHASSRWQAWLILLLLVAAFMGGLRWDGPAREQTAPASAASDHADVRLYERVIEGVHNGGEYYSVAAAAHREGAYPLRPFVTVRLPTLAWMHAALPWGGATILLYFLAAATALAWARRLWTCGDPAIRAVIGAALVAAGAATLLRPELAVWHEGWAALLMALSLALRRDGSFSASLAAAACALAIREHAVLLPMVMVAFALWERRWREVGAWALLIAAFALFLAWHAAQVAAVTLPSDPASPGWAGGGGWSAAVAMVQATGPLRLFPAPLAALLVPVALLGWAAWRPGERAAALIGANLLMLALFARADNFYWAFLIAPLLPLGLLFAPRALADLGRAAFLPSARPLST
jgi:hypothetical protein